MRLVGTAHQQIETMDISHNVKIGSCDVTNKYDAQKKTTYTNYVIFNFEDNNNGAAQKPAARTDSTECWFYEYSRRCRG